MFSIFVIILRKIIKNKWLVLSLVVGITISTALLSSIPTYTNGILQRMLIKDLQIYQEKNLQYPGYMKFQSNLYGAGADLNRRFYNNVDAYSRKVPDMIKLPLLSASRFLSAECFKVVVDQYKEGTKDSRKDIYFRLCAKHGMEENIRIIDGRMPAASKAEGAYEAIVAEETLARLDLVVGKELNVHDYLNDDNPSFKIRIVGVFERKPGSELFWHGTRYDDASIFINYDVMNNELLQKSLLTACGMQWDFCFDYNAIKVQKTGDIIETDAKLRDELKERYKNSLAYSFPVKNIIEQFYEKRQRLLTIILSINIPVLVMLGLFIFMVSFLKVQRERNEISVLMSRGAGRLQVTLIYLLEGICLAAVSMALGPPGGLFLSRLIGAANGFLEFVNRTAVDVSLQRSSYVYALLGAVLSVIVLAVPAFLASRSTVVMHKQNVSRRIAKPFWRKSYLDVILLGVSGYGIYIFNRRQRTLLETGLAAKYLEIDPLLFVVPAIFIIAVALVFLRVLPALINLLFKAGKRFWTPSLYGVLLQVCRSGTQYYFLLLFLAFTLALGLFSANAARTINLNAEEKIKYSIGADIVIMPQWNVYNAHSNNLGGSPMGQSEPRAVTSYSAGPKQYIEPDFTGYTKLKGVEIATKVYKTDRCSITVGDERHRTELMAINTEEFGKISWFRTDLLPHHWYEYLNLIAQEPAAVLVSRSLAKAGRLKPGDIININWGESGSSAPFVVFGVIDYWPSWNPNPRATEVETNGERKIVYEPEPMLIVANLQYVQDNMPLEPYEIWIKLDPKIEIADFYEDIKNKYLQVVGITNLREELIKLKNDPLRMGINGALTLAFILSAIVCLMGFILYWTLSIRSRELQFGVFRAIGLSLRQLLTMLVWEQVLTSGAGVLAGILVGRVASSIFVPFFQISYSSYEQVPPFRIVFNIDDRIKLYILVAVMITTGFAILGFLVSKIKIAQILKLGED